MRWRRRALTQRTRGGRKIERSMCIAIRCGFGRTDSGRDPLVGGISCAMWHWPLRRRGVASAGIQRHHGEEHRERYPETQWPDGSVIAAPGGGDGHRCGAQSAGAWALRSPFRSAMKTSADFVFGAMRIRQSRRWRRSCFHWRIE